MRADGPVLAGGKPAASDLRTKSRMSPPMELTRLAHTMGQIAENVIGMSKPPWPSANGVIEIHHRAETLLCRDHQRTRAGDQRRESRGHPPDPSRCRSRRTERRATRIPWRSGASTPSACDGARVTIATTPITTAATMNRPAA
jgi:hypothetical protein